nr:hypothetical protein [Tsukamurella pulmonis]
MRRQPRRCLWRDPAVGDEPGVGEERENQVGAGDVGTHDAGAAAPADECVQRTFRVVDRCGTGGMGIPVEERPGESAIAGLQREDRVHQGAQAVPGVGIGESVVERTRASAELLLEGLGHEMLARGEAAVQRRDADPGPAGDRTERSIDPAGREDLLGRAHDPLPVTPRVGPQRGLRAGR